MPLTLEQQKILSNAIDFYYYASVLKLTNPTCKPLPISVNIAQDDINKILTITLDVGLNIKIKNPPPNEMVFFATNHCSELTTWKCYLFKSGQWVKELNDHISFYSSTYGQDQPFEDFKYFNLELKESASDTTLPWK